MNFASVTCSLKISGNKFKVDPLILFQRVCIANKSEDQKELFKFELAPFPMSLFTKEGMRKGTKPAMSAIVSGCDTTSAPYGLGRRKFAAPSLRLPPPLQQ